MIGDFKATVLLNDDEEHDAVSEAIDGPEAVLLFGNAGGEAFGVNVEQARALVAVLSDWIDVETEEEFQCPRAEYADHECAFCNNGYIVGAREAREVERWDYDQSA